MTERWAAIVGSGREGRREVTRAVIDALRDAGARVGGVRQVRRADGGYDCVNIASGARHPLTYSSSTPEMCDYTFSHDVFEAARRWSLAEPYDVVFVEAGRLEARGRGHWPLVRQALAKGALVVLSVRPMVLARVALSLADDPVAYVEAPCGPGEVAGLVRALRPRQLRPHSPDNPRPRM